MNSAELPIAVRLEELSRELNWGLENIVERTEEWLRVECESRVIDSLMERANEARLDVSLAIGGRRLTIGTQHYALVSQGNPFDLSELMITVLAESRDADDAPATIGSEGFASVGAYARVRVSASASIGHLLEDAAGVAKGVLESGYAWLREKLLLLWQSEDAAAIAELYAAVRSQLGPALTGHVLLYTVVPSGGYYLLDAATRQSVLESLSQRYLRTPASPADLLTVLETTVLKPEQIFAFDAAVHGETRAGESQSLRYVSDAPEFLVAEASARAWALDRSFVCDPLVRLSGKRAGIVAVYPGALRQEIAPHIPAIAQLATGVMNNRGSLLGKFRHRLARRNGLSPMAQDVVEAIAVFTGRLLKVFIEE